jgi:predicted ribosome quality control (RQC) complex YloA/Tae2 family protein
MNKYLLVEVNSDDDVIVKYFGDLTDVYAYVCHELIYNDLDIEDFKNYPYSSVEERIEEHESSFYLFEDEKELFHLVKGDIIQGDWEKFTELCLKTMKESKIMNYKSFNESKKDKFPNIQKLEIEGFVVYVGKDAKSNDHLTFNVADKEDIWMHVKGVPGSHVVIRVRENLPIETVIKLAAQLAKKNSKASKDDSATVVYCQRKFVKKEPGMNDGQVKVDYTNSYQIVV